MAMIWGRDLDSYFDENGKPIKDIKSKVVEDWYYLTNIIKRSKNFIKFASLFNL